MGLADEIAARSTEGASIVMGVITSVSTAGAVTVNVGGVDNPNILFALQGYAPKVGDGIVLLRQGNQLIALGSSGPPLLASGTVTLVPPGSPTIEVQVGGSTYALPFLSSYTPVLSDAVYVHWAGSTLSGVVLGKVGATPAPPPPAAPPAPPPSAPTTGTTTFAATHDGTWRSGWRTDANGDVIQGTAPGFAGLNEGAWFYSGLIRGSLAGATVTGMEIFLGRTSGGVFASQTCHLYRVANDTRPGGALTFGSGPYDIGLAVGQEGWFSLSTSLGQELVDSGGSVGIKAASGPYMRMYGLSRSGSAGALRISWRR